MQGRLRTGIVTAAAVLVLLGVSAGAGIMMASPTHALTVSFPSADGLLVGSDVFEAGARAGTVTGITPQRDNTALVTLDVDSSVWPLHTGLRAAIRPKSLLGEKYVALTDGPADAAAYPAGKTLVENTPAVPVELDQFINSLDPTTRVAAHTLLDDFGAGVAGTGPQLNSGIAAARADLAHLATTGTTLNGRDADLDRILVSLDTVLGTLTTNDQLTQLQGLISNGRQTVTALDSEQQVLRRSFTDAATTLSELNTALDSAIPALQQTLGTAPGLVSHLTTEAQGLATLAGGVNTPTTLQQLIQGIEHGPTTTGGALETHGNGTALPIFRVCLLMPAGPSCEGNGFRPASDTGPGTNSQAVFAVYTAELAS